MKKILYIFCFTLLGLIIATLIHAGVELVALSVIFESPEQFADTFWWQEWDMLHGIGSAALWVLGLAFGLYGGFRYWDILYVKRNRTS